MKRALAVLVTVSLLACNESTTTRDTKVDSLGEKIKEEAKETWDSTKAGAKELKEKLKINWIISKIQ